MDAGQSVCGGVGFFGGLRHHEARGPSADPTQDDSGVAMTVRVNSHGSCDACQRTIAGTTTRADSAHEQGESWVRAARGTGRP